MLGAFFQKNTFIKDQITKSATDPEVMQNLFRNMRLMEMAKKQTVFNYGDQGELFYFII